MGGRSERTQGQATHSITIETHLQLHMCKRIKKYFTVIYSIIGSIFHYLISEGL